MPHKFIIYGTKKRIPQGVVTRELFDSAEDAQAFIDENPRYSKYLQSEHIKLKIEKYYLHQCTGCGKDLLPEDRLRTVHSCVMNYRGTVLIGDDPDKIYCQECGDKLQPVEPEPVGSPVTMVLGEPWLECKNMSCYMFNKFQERCMMDGEGCDAINKTIRRFGPIVGLQIVDEAMWNYNTGDDVESLLMDAAKKITGTI